MIFCTVVSIRRNDGNDYAPDFNCNPDYHKLNSNWVDNERNGNYAALVGEQLSLFFRLKRKFFFQLAYPATEHFANLIKPFGKNSVFFAVERLNFPANS